MPDLTADALRSTPALADEGKCLDADLEGCVAEFEDIADPPLPGPKGRSRH